MIETIMETVINNFFIKIPRVKHERGGIMEDKRYLKARIFLKNNITRNPPSIIITD